MVSIYKFQSKHIYEIMKMQTSLYIKQIENDLTALQDELEYLSGTQDLCELLEKEEISQSLFSRLKLFFEKYSPMVDNLEIFDKQVRRTYTREKGNYYRLSSLERHTNFIPQLRFHKTIKNEDDIIEILYPIKNENNEIHANIRISINLSDYLISQLKHYNLGGNSWWFLINNRGQIFAVFFNNKFISPNEVKIVNLSTISMSLDKGLSGFVDHKAIINNKSYKLLSAYSIFSVYESKYGIVSSLLKTRIFHIMLFNMASFFFIVLILMAAVFYIVGVNKLKSKKVYEEIKKIEISASSFIAELPIAVVGFNNQYEFVQINEKAIELFSISEPKALLGEKLSELKKDLLPIELFNNRNVDKELRIDCEINNEKKYLLRYNHEVFFNDKVTKLMCFLDISTQELLKQNIDESKKERARFLSVLSHEIRTPLTGIMGFTSLLSKHDLGEKFDVFIKNIIAACEQILQVTHNTIELAQIENQSMKIYETIIDFEHLFNELKSQYKQSHNLDIEVNLAAQIVPVLGDLAKIRMILTSLIDNSIKLNKDSKICINVDIQDEDKDSILAAFVITDTSLGLIVTEEKEQLKSFKQDELGIFVEQKGVGSGLIIAYKLAELLYSQIYVRSNNGEGTEFSFTVKLQKIQEN